MPQWVADEPIIAQMFYSQYSGVVPDIQIMAKGIAGGLPLSGIVAKKELMKGQKPGSMGGTYGEPTSNRQTAASDLTLASFVSRKRPCMRRRSSRSRRL